MGVAANAQRTENTKGNAFNEEVILLKVAFMCFTIQCCPVMIDIATGGGGYPDQGMYLRVSDDMLCCLR